VLFKKKKKKKKKENGDYWHSLNMKGTGWNRKLAAPICICESASHMFFVYFSRSNQSAGDSQICHRHCLSVNHPKEMLLWFVPVSEHMFFGIFLKGSYHFTSAATKACTGEEQQIAGHEPYTGSALA
jgi:hypothetical protein